MAGESIKGAGVAGSLAERLLKDNLTVTYCFQCRKCSGGCPMTFAMDLLPDQVVRLAILGQEEEMLRARTPWVCSGCETCATRCPNGIDVPGVMDWLKEEAARRRKTVPEEEVRAFHHLFLSTVMAEGGRLSETHLLGRYTMFKIRREFNLENLKADMALGWQLWKRERLRLRGIRSTAVQILKDQWHLWRHGRLRLLGPHHVKGKEEIKDIFRRVRF